MAATELLLKRQLVVSMHEGVDETGKDIVKRYAYSNIKTSSTPDGLLQAAVAITNLSNGTYYEINTVDTSVLDQA